MVTTSIPESAIAATTFSEIPNTTSHPENPDHLPAALAETGVPVTEQNQLDDDKTIECDICKRSFDPDGTFHSFSNDGVCFCDACSYTYEDLLKDPENFICGGTEDEPIYHTAETAKKEVDEYIAAGGCVGDKIGYREWLKEHEANNAPA